MVGCIEQDKNVSKLNDEEQAKVDEYAAEVEVGRNMAGRLLQYFGTVEEESVVRYMNQVGRYVASYSDFPDRRYMFNIIDTEEINAFACPGGYILVTVGALRKLQSEAEFAAVLGHEVAHVGLRHMFNTLKAMDEDKLNKEANEVEKRAKIKIPIETKVRERPSASASDTANLIARYMAGSSGASLSILNAAKAGMSVILEKGLDKKLEFEADREGVRYAVRAGYLPVAMLDLFKRIEDRRKSLNLKTLGKTHPTFKQRRAKIRKLLKELNAKEIVGAVAKTRYSFYRDKLPEVKKRKSKT